MNSIVNHYKAFCWTIFLLCANATIFLFMFDVLENPLVPTEYTVISLSEPTALGFFLSNFNHAGPIHLLFNMLFLKDIYKYVKEFSVLKKHTIILIGISVIIIPIVSFIVMSELRTENSIVLGFSGVLSALFGLLLGVKIEKTLGLFVWIMGFHLGLIFGFDINIAWEVHLIGFLLGYGYQKVVFSKIPTFSLKETLNKYEIGFGQNTDNCEYMGVYDWLVSCGNNNTILVLKSLMDTPVTIHPDQVLTDDEMRNKLVLNAKLDDVISVVYSILRADKSLKENHRVMIVK
jgi:membrane associated rhomboid family serine protease